MEITTTIRLHLTRNSELKTHSKRKYTENDTYPRLVYKCTYFYEFSVSDISNVKVSVKSDCHNSDIVYPFHST